MPNPLRPEADGRDDAPTPPGGDDVYMSRIRSAKPSWWSDQLLATLPRDQRFTFKGLIEVSADDEGRFIADPRRVKGQVWPYDDDLTTEWVDATLTMLEQLGKDDDDGELGRIALYTHKGFRYGWIVRWLRHQRVDNVTPSTLPPPPFDDVIVTRYGRKTRGRASIAKPGKLVVIAGGAPARVPKHNDAIVGAIHEQYPHTAAAIASKKLMRELLTAVTEHITTKAKRVAFARSFLEAAENAIKRGYSPEAVASAAEDYLGAIASQRETPNVGRWRGFIRSAHAAMGDAPARAPDARRSGRYAYKPSTKEARI